MADKSKLELVIEVDPSNANTALKSVNSSLSRMEQAAVKGAASASAGMDGFTASMVKGATAGNLIADVIKKAIEFAKSWTVEAAKMAAHESRMEASGRALAKAHGIANEEFERSVEAVKKIGFHGEDAIHAIDRLIIADLGLEKAQGLAKVAKDAAAIEDIGAPEALEKLLQAIEFGNARALRSAGIRVQFEEAITANELQLGRTLSENEKAQIRYNAVIEAAAAIQGAHAGAAGEAESQMKALSREVVELKQAVGAEFQDEFKRTVGVFRDLVGWLKDNSDLLVKFGQTAIWLAGILVTYGLATKVLDIVGAVGKLSIVLAAHPWALALTGVVAAGAILYKQYSDMRGGMERSAATERQAQIRRMAGEAGGLKKLRAQGLSDADIREALGGARELESGDIGYKSIVKIKGQGQPDIEALKLAAEVRKKQKENEAFFAERALAASGAGKTGYAKDVAEINTAIAKQTSFVDDRGVAHVFTLTKAAWASVVEEAQQKFAAFKEKLLKDNREVASDYLKSQAEIAESTRNFENQRVQQRFANDLEIANRNMEHMAEAYQIQEQQSGYTRDRQLRALEGVDAQTIQQKVWIEQRKADIEIEYLQKTNEIKTKLFDMETRRQIMEEELTMKRLGYRADEITARLDELNQQRGEIKGANQGATDEAVLASRENAANRQTELIRDHYRSIFESLKQQAGGVFDALLTKSQSVWSAIGNSFKTAILTAIKEVVTSRVAAMLMQLFTGQKVSFAGGGSGPVIGSGSGRGSGMLGGLGSLLGLGAMPAFGGGGGGSTPPFWPSGTSAPGAGTGAGALSNDGMMGGLKSNVAGFKGMLSSLGNVGYKPSRWSMDEAGNMTQLAGARGVNGWKGGAMLAGGGILAMDGLRRGGWTGVGETTGGGALIGGKFGGPIGAAIGAAAGFLAGAIRLGIKGATEKVREKIKSLYGVDISDKKILREIVDVAKQSYSGNLDMAVRSEQVRDIVRLYAQTMGQKTSLTAMTPHAGSLLQSGGRLFQGAVYENGQAYTYASGFDTYGGVQSRLLPTASPASGVSVHLDPQQTMELWRTGTTEAMSSNPRLVANSALRGNQTGGSRAGSATNLFAPSVITQ